MLRPHSLVLIKFFHQPVFTQLTPTLCNNSTNWKFFRDYLDASTNCNIPLNIPEQIEVAVVKFINLIQDAEWISTKQPEFERKFNSFPNHIMQLIKHKRKQKYMWQKQKTSHNKKKFNAITKEIKQSILKHCNDEFHTSPTYLLMTRQTIFYGKSPKTKTDSRLIISCH